MSNSEIKATIRTFYREKSYALVNLSGLSLAIACCLILGLYLRNELTYDRHNLKYKQIYRLANEFNTSGTSDRVALSSMSIGPMLKEHYPEIKAFVRLMPVSLQEKILIRSGEKTFYWRDIYLVDENIFDVFTFRFVYGNPKGALKDPSSAAVSETFARKYFGDANPIGKLINLDTGDKSPKKITLVFRDLPENTHMKYCVLLRFPNPPSISPQNLLFSASNYTYFLMPGNFNPDNYKAVSSSFYAKFMDSMGKAVGITWKSWLEPLADIHLYSDLSYDLPTGNRYYVFGFAAVAIFILLVACINYVNLATARAAKRAKEIGMRKILGAPRILLIFRFLSEAVLFSAVAMVISIGLVEAVLKMVPVNDLFGKVLTLNFTNEPSLFLWMLGLTLLVGLLSGLYPALYLSSISPLSALTDSQKGKKGGFRLRELLVLTQFAVSVIVIACTCIMALQMRYVSNKPLGFSKENRIGIYKRGAEVTAKYPVIKNELLKNSHILGVTSASVMISTDQILPHRAPMVDNRDGTTTERLVIRNLQVKEDFFEVMGIQMASGRDFSKRLLTDVGTSFIVNETMVKNRGWKDPLGKRIQMDQFDGRVVGVVKDFHFRSLHNAMEPLIINPINSQGSGGVLILKISDKDVPQTLNFLQKQFADYDPRHAFDFAFLDDSIDKLYMSEKRLMKMTGIFSGICIFISCLGLFGLASYTTEQRRKEIGIRKVLGASASQIIIMLAQRILWLVLAGSVIATIAAYYAMDEWLSGFAYRKSINPLVFVISAVLVIAVAFITVALQSYKTAQENPAVTIRYE